MRLLFVCTLFVLAAHVAIAQEAPELIDVPPRVVSITGSLSAGPGTNGRAIRGSLELAANEYITVVTRVADTAIASAPGRVASRGQELTFGATYRLLVAGPARLTVGPLLGIGTREFSAGRPGSPVGGRDSNIDGLLGLEADLSFRLLPLVQAVSVVSRINAVGVTPQDARAAERPRVSYTSVVIGVRIGR